MSSVHSIPTPHCTAFLSISKVPKPLGLEINFFSGQRSGRHQKKVHFFDLCEHTKRTANGFFEFGSFSCTFGSVSYIRNHRFSSRSVQQCWKDHQRLHPGQLATPRLPYGCIVSDKKSGRLSDLSTSSMVPI